MLGTMNLEWCADYAQYYAMLYCSLQECTGYAQADIKPNPEKAPDSVFALRHEVLMRTLTGSFAGLCFLCWCRLCGDHLQN